MPDPEFDSGTERKVVIKSPQQNVNMAAELAKDFLSVKFPGFDFFTEVLEDMILVLREYITMNEG